MLPIASCRANRAVKTRADFGLSQYVHYEMSVPQDERGNKTDIVTHFNGAKVRIYSSFILIVGPRRSQIQNRKLRKFLMMTRVK